MEYPQYDYAVIEEICGRYIWREELAQIIRTVCMLLCPHGRAFDERRCSDARCKRSFRDLREACTDPAAFIGPICSVKTA